MLIYQLLPSPCFGVYCTIREAMCFLQGSKSTWSPWNSWANNAM